MCVSVVLVAQYNRETALHNAAACNSLKVAEVLVAANANVDIKTKVHESWLQLAWC